MGKNLYEVQFEHYTDKMKVTTFNTFWWFITTLAMGQTFNIPNIFKIDMVQILITKPSCLLYDNYFCNNIY